MEVKVGTKLEVEVGPGHEELCEAFAKYRKTYFGVSNGVFLAKITSLALNSNGGLDITGEGSSLDRPGKYLFLFSGHYLPAVPKGTFVVTELFY